MTQTRPECKEKLRYGEYAENKRFMVYAFYTNKVICSKGLYQEALRNINSSIKRGDCDCNNLIIIDKKNYVKYNYKGKMTDLTILELKLRPGQADY